MRHKDSRHKNSSQTVHKRISLIYSLKNFVTKDDGEKQFVFLEERSADVAVQAVGEVVGEIAQTTLEDLRLDAESSIQTTQRFTLRQSG